MSIEKINSALPVSLKITTLSDYILQVEGKGMQGKFNKYEIDALYSGTGLSRKYIRDYSLGHARTGAGAWYNWEHVTRKTGYSIWKFGIYNYQHNADNLLKYDSKVVDYRGEATSEASLTFDSVFLYDGASYTDKTTDAGTKAENNFDILEDSSSYIYIGDDAVFTGVAFELQTFGSEYTLVFAYWNGSEWKQLTSNDHDLTDNTENLIMDGLATFTNVGDWATTAVDGTTRYWIRISTTTTPEVTASAYSILPGRAVPELLLLSSSEVQDEDWKWCYFEDGVPATGAAYVTVRNAGAAAYEGDYYIHYSSSDANKENFFYANHEYQIDHEDISYDESLALSYLYDITDASGEILRDMVVSCSGAGIREASALDGWRPGVAICRNQPYSGSTAKIQNFGLAPRIYTESKGNIIKGTRLWLGTGSGQVTRTKPTGISQIQQEIGTAWANESGGKVSALLNIGVWTVTTETEPIVYNKTLTTAGVEYTQVIPTDTSKILVQCRQSKDVYMSYATGAVATGAGASPAGPYYTVKAGSSYWDDELDTEIITLYLASAPGSGGSNIMEILVWEKIDRG